MFHPSVLCLLFGGFNQIRLSEDRLKAKSHFYQKICQKYFGYTTVATFRDVGKKYLHNILPLEFERLFLKLGISKFFRFFDVFILEKPRENSDRYKILYT